jgi:hypothetical protein
MTFDFDPKLRPWSILVWMNWAEKLAALRVCFNCHRKLREFERGYCAICSSTK